LKIQAKKSAKKELPPKPCLSKIFKQGLQ